MNSSLCWPQTTLGEIAEFRNGVNYTKDNFGCGVKVINVKDFQDYSTPKYNELEEIKPDGVVKDQSLLHQGDIVFVRSNGNRELIGRSMMILEPPGTPITHSAFTIRVRFRPNERINDRFYFYVMRSGLIRQILSSQGSGANISNLNQDILAQLKLPVPPLATQQCIASILSTYDDLMENNTRRIAILEEMARRLYEEWFVCFRFPGHEDAKFVDGLSERWVEKELQEVAHLTMGQSPKSEFYNTEGQGLPFHQGVSNFGAFFPADRLFCSVENRLAEAGDILFSVRAPVGRINLATKKIVIGRGLSAIRSKSEHQVFLLSQLRHRFAEEDCMGSGAIFNSITKKDLQTVTVPTPTPDLVERFEAIAEPYWQTIRLLSSKNTNLRAQRDLLLPRLISGEIDIAAAERLLEDAA